MVVTNSLAGGGAERSMNLLVNELHKRGWQICLVPINIGIEDNIVVKCEVFKVGRKWQGGAWNTILAWLRFVRFVKNWRPTDLILNCDITEFFGATIPIRVKNLIVVEHANPAWSTRKTFGKVVRAILFLRQSKWLAVSDHLVIWPSKKKPTMVLQNSIEISPRPVINSEDCSKHHITRLVFVGRLAEPQKRPSWVLEIARILGYPVLFIGNGAMQGELERRAMLYETKVEFVGFVKEPWSLITIGDLVIFPSAWEGDGMVVLEAMAHEIPFLLTDIPDFRRFHLPDSNYCISLKNFCSRVNDFSKSLESLKIPSETKDRILQSRNSKAVGDSWENYLLKKI
jgi:glycosyltransferase involved in cell wall biosynthesis